MINKMFAVRDNKVGAFLTPFMNADEKIAVRSLQMAMADKSMQLSFFPEDFDLYQVGTFDDESGLMEAIMPPKLVVTCVAVKAAENARIMQEMRKPEEGKNE